MRRVSFPPEKSDVRTFLHGIAPRPRDSACNGGEDQDGANCDLGNMEASRGKLSKWWQSVQCIALYNLKVATSTSLGSATAPLDGAGSAVRNK